MALWQLGRDKEAKATLQQLRGQVKEEWFSEKDPYFGGWSRVFLTLVIEVEKLFATEDSTLMSILELIAQDELDRAAEVVEKVRSSEDAVYSDSMDAAATLLRILYCMRGKDRWGKSGDHAEMIADYEMAARVDPNNAQAFAELGWIRATCPTSEFRDGKRAVEAATRACELVDWKNHEYIATLAAAHSETGVFDDAVKWQKKAIDLMPEEERTELQPEYQERLELYESGKSYSEGERWSYSKGELVAWWNFDEVRDGNAVDASGHGLHGILVGDANIVTDPKRGRVLQVGGNGFVDCGNPLAFSITGSITVSAWAKIDRLNALDRRYQSIVTKGHETWRLQRYGRYDPIQFKCNGVNSAADGAPGTGIRGNVEVDDGRWHHIAGVYDGKMICLYVDGELDLSKPAWGYTDSDDSPVYIGSNSQVVGREWTGLIDDVRIYSYPLSAEEVKMLYDGREPPRKKEP